MKQRNKATNGPKQGIFMSVFSASKNSRWLGLLYALLLKETIAHHLITSLPHFGCY